MMGYKPVEPAGDAPNCPQNMPLSEGKVPMSLEKSAHDEQKKGHNFSKDGHNSALISKKVNITQTQDEAIKAKNVKLGRLVRALLDLWISGVIPVDEQNMPLSGENMGTFEQKKGHNEGANMGTFEEIMGTIKPIQEDIEVLRENIEILFNLNKNREEEIKELKKRIYELEAELRAYLLDRAEKGDISREQKMEVEEE